MKFLQKMFYSNFPKQYGQFLYFKEMLVLPFKLLKLNLGFDVFFGGKEQDRWILCEIFNYKKNGYFIDLAASDGILGNNTYLLEKKYNWTGIAIEPNPKFFSVLKNKRKCTCVDQVISEKNSTVNFFYNGGIGGIIGEEYDNRMSKRSNIISNKKKKNLIKKMKTITLYQLLKKFSAPPVIDYLSLDIEGAETSVLKNFPFSKYIFLSMTIERPTSLLNKILKENGYIFIKNQKVDTFYLHETLQKKLSLKTATFEQLPPKSW